MKGFLTFVLILALITGTLSAGSAQTITVNVNTQTGGNATQNLTLMLNRLTFVINAIAISILSILWIWEGLFLFFHKDDREGMMKFKHDLPVMIIASVIILGASVIVNILGYIAHG